MVSKQQCYVGGLEILGIVSINHSFTIPRCKITVSQMREDCFEAPANMGCSLPLLPTPKGDGLHKSWVSSQLEFKIVNCLWWAMMLEKSSVSSAINFNFVSSLFCHIVQFIHLWYKSICTIIFILHMYYNIIIIILWSWECHLSHNTMCYIHHYKLL